MNDKDLRDFLFRGLMFEAEVKSLRDLGLKIGADQSLSEQQLLNESLSPFPISLRNRALEMSRLYSVIFAFENHVREYIRDTLFESEGSDWIQKLPKKILDLATSRQEQAIKDSWLEGEKTDLLGFLEFGHLAQLIVSRWENFEAMIPSQHWLKQRMDELEKCRHFIAHNRMLLPTEFQRVYMYISDWNRVVGL